MVFVDTGAWIALSDRSDQHHEEARRIYERLKLDRIRFLTSDYVIDETVTRLRYDSSHKHAVRFLDLIARAQEIKVLQRVELSPLNCSRPLLCSFANMIQRSFPSQTAPALPFANSFRYRKRLRLTSIS